MTWIGLGCLLLGLLLIVKPLPLLGRPTTVRPQAIEPAEFLDILIEQQQAGHTPFQAVVAAFEMFDHPAPRGPDQVAVRVASISPHYATLWRLLHQRGAGLLDAAVTLRAAEAARVELHQEVEVKIAATRSTTRLLLWLPWGFTAVGQLAGMHSLTVLFTTWWGVVLIAIASALTWTGLRWVERILATVRA